MAFSSINGIQVTSGNETGAAVSGGLPDIAVSQNLLFVVCADKICDNGTDEGNCVFGTQHVATPNFVGIGNNAGSLKGTGFVDSAGTIVSFSAVGTSNTEVLILGLDRNTGNGYLWQKAVGAAALMETVDSSALVAINLSGLTTTAFNLEPNSTDTDKATLYSMSIWIWGGDFPTDSEVRGTMEELQTLGFKNRLQFPALFETIG
jgi:hypothetical protein